MRVLALAALLLVSGFAGCLKPPEYVDVPSKDFVNDPGKYLNKGDRSAKVYIRTRTLVDHEEHREWTTMVMICNGKGGCTPFFTHHVANTYGVHSTTDPASNEVKYRNGHGGYRTSGQSWTATVEGAVWYEEDWKFLWLFPVKGRGLVRDIDSVK